MGRALATMNRANALRQVCAQFGAFGRYQRESLRGPLRQLMEMSPAVLHLISRSARVEEFGIPRLQRLGFGERLDAIRESSVGQIAPHAAQVGIASGEIAQRRL